MTAARTINFTLNGLPVTADVKPHHNLVELLQRELKKARDDLKKLAAVKHALSSAIDGDLDEAAANKLRERLAMGTVLETENETATCVTGSSSASAHASAVESPGTANHCAVGWSFAESAHRPYARCIADAPRSVGWTAIRSAFVASCSGPATSCC